MMTSLKRKKTQHSTNVSKIPAYVAIGILLVMFVIGQLAYGRFFYFGTISSLLNDNAYLIILAVGMTVPILTGGIDLSVGAVVALSSVIGCELAVKGVPWVLCAIIMVLIGTLFGVCSGTLIRYFDMQPFIATLAMMYLGQGLAAIISIVPVSLGTSGNAAGLLLFDTEIKVIDGPKINDLSISIGTIIAVLVVAGAYFIMHKTRHGRTIYAMGAPAKQSASLMGLPTGTSLSLIYIISGTLAGIATVVYVSGVGKGQNIMGQGWELNAIACAVIGGTIITGGSGYVLGSVVGGLVYSTMNLILSRDGRVPATWATIITGVLLLLFVLLQRVIISTAEKAEEKTEKKVKDPTVATSA